MMNGGPSLTRLPCFTKRDLTHPHMTLGQRDEALEAQPWRSHGREPRGRGFPGDCPTLQPGSGGPLGAPAPACTHEQSQPRMGLAHLSGQLTAADHIPEAAT